MALRSILPLLLALALAAPALAVDTWEPYPLGPSTLEVYVQRFGRNAEDDAEKGYRTTFGPAWGLWDGGHVYSFLSLTSDDDLRGGLDYLSAGGFANLLDRDALKLDGYAEIGAVGTGLAAVYRLIGLEANLDFQGWGFYARGARQWEDGGEDEGEQLVGKRTLYTEGLYIQPSEIVQIFGEITHEDSKGVAGTPDGDRRTSFALGYNRVITKQVELIAEMRRHELPAGVDDGKKLWDYSVGLVTVW